MPRVLSQLHAPNSLNIGLGKYIGLFRKGVNCPISLSLTNQLPNVDQYFVPYILLYNGHFCYCGSTQPLWIFCRIDY